MADKDIKVRITGDASQLGVESKKAVDAFNSIKASAMSMLAGFTGGLIGGGIAGSIQAVVGIVSDKIREARELIQQADKLDITAGTLRGVRKAERALDLGGSIVAAIEALRQARADAGRGEPNAVSAFSRLGVSLEEIDRLAPDKLFARIADVFKGQNAPLDRRQALAQLIGKSAADDLTPYFAGGGDSDIRRRFGLDPQLRLNFGDLGSVSRLLRDPENRKRYRMEMEPLSMYGVGDEEKATRLARENDQRALAVRRSMLSIEEQIAAVTQQRTELERAAAQETNSVKREQIRADMIGLDAELVRLQQQGATRTPPKLQGFDRQQIDEFAQRGLFIGGAPRVQVVAEQQLDQLRQAVTEIRNLRNDQKGLW